MNVFIKSQQTTHLTNKEFTIDFDIQQNQFVQKKEVDLILMYIDSFLSTPKGSLFFNREFGTTIYNFIAEPLDDQTISEIQTIFTEELFYSLPMIQFNNVYVYPSTNNKKTIIVDIEFTFDKQNFKVVRNISTPIKRVY